MDFDERCGPLPPSGYKLSNNMLEVKIRPSEGGRVASLRCRNTGLEFLVQARQDRPNFEPGFAARFQDGPSAGIEECLPTVGPCEEETPGGPVPDHGDFWQLAWIVTHATDTALCMGAQGFSRPITFRKEFSLAGSALSIRYTVTNVGNCDVSILYACHPLFAIETGDRIFLPEEVSSLQLNYSRGNRVGVKNAVIAWPVTAAAVALNEVQPASTGFAEMLYTQRVSQGSCGIYRSSQGQGIAVRFDPLLLPFLGVWLCYGGWPDDCETPRQYAVALEPTTAAANTLTEAVSGGQARVLHPGHSAYWSIAFEVSKPETSLENFRSWLLRSSL
jgi:galactose mutarotase-like enzyme